MHIYTITHFRRRDGLGRRTQQSTLLEALEAAIKAEMLDANSGLSDEDVLTGMTYSDAQVIDEISKLAAVPEASNYDVRAYLVQDLEGKDKDRVYFVAGPTSDANPEDLIVCEVSVKQEILDGEVFDWQRVLWQDENLEEWNREEDALEQHERVKGIEPWRLEINLTAWNRNRQVSRLVGRR